MESAAPKASILIVEDDAAIGRLIQLHLQVAGYAADLCETGDQAMEQLAGGHWDLLILDRMLPGPSGMQVLRWLRGREGEVRLPVLMVTALGQTAERVQGLNEGADDYLAKPFEPEELVARVAALLRRNRPASKLSVAGIDLDPEAVAVHVHGQPLNLRPMEFKLLQVMMAKPGRVRSREYLLNHVWGSDHFVEPRTVDATIKRLRQALAVHKLANRIETVRSMGYRFVEQVKDGA